MIMHRETPCRRPRNCILAFAAMLPAIGALGGCGPPLPIAEYSSFGEPSRTRVYSATTQGTVTVSMEPAEYRGHRREGLTIEEFRSPTGSKGHAFIHYPKGIMELKLVAFGVNRTGADMTYEWTVVQKGRPVQEIQVRIVPRTPVRVFVNKQAISIEQD